MWGGRRSTVLGVKKLSSPSRPYFNKLRDPGTYPLALCQEHVALLKQYACPDVSLTDAGLG